MTHRGIGQASNWDYLEDVFENKNLKIWVNQSKSERVKQKQKIPSTPLNIPTLSLSPSLIRALSEWNQLLAEAPRQAARHLQCYPW